MGSSSKLATRLKGGENEWWSSIRCGNCEVATRNQVLQGANGAEHQAVD